MFDLNENSRYITAELLAEKGITLHGARTSGGRAITLPSGTTYMLPVKTYVSTPVYARKSEENESFTRIVTSPSSSDPKVSFPFEGEDEFHSAMVSAIDHLREFVDGAVCWNKDILTLLDLDEYLKLYPSLKDLVDQLNNWFPRDTLPAWVVEHNVGKTPITMAKEYIRGLVSNAIATYGRELAAKQMGISSWSLTDLLQRGTGTPQMLNSIRSTLVAGDDGSGLSEAIVTLHFDPSRANLSPCDRTRDLALEIQRMRLSMGMSPADVARTVLVTDKYVAQWEVGRLIMSPDHADQFIEYAVKHGMDITELYEAYIRTYVHTFKVIPLLNAIDLVTLSSRKIDGVQLDPMSIYVGGKEL